jgi:DNA-binding response OmpR family regulator
LALATEARVESQMTNLSDTGKQRIVLFVSPNDEDHRALIHILRPAGWSLDSAFSWVEAIKSLEAEPAPVVIVERDLPDGNWKTLHNRLMQMPFPPKLIVTCRLADERLWAEVLNLGGFDVLAQPFCAREVLRSVNSACSHWDEEWRKAHGGIEEAACCTTA